MDGIELSGVTRSYPVEGRTLTVLRDLDLQVPAGKAAVLIGRSGCGKTTLLRLVAGLETPDRGVIRLSEGLRTAMVFQEPRLMPWLNVTGNLLFGLGRKEAARADTGAMLRLVGLEGFEKARVNQLSGGMQQRVALARALMVRPGMLLMDEPFASLDHFTRAEMQQEILRLRRKTGIGMLFVTHSLEEAILLGDTVHVLSGGALHGSFQVPEGRTPEETERLKRSLLACLGEEIRV